MNIGVFTTLKVIDGIPLFWNMHQKRLIEQAKKLNLGEINISVQNIRTYLQKNNLTECALQITITKQNRLPILSIQHRPLPQTSINYKLITFDDKRNYRKIYKTTDRAVNEQAKKLAEETGANDALFTTDKTIIESTIANVFSLDKKGEIITPPITKKGLNGITRQLIKRHGNIVETDIHQNTKGPLVLVNCLRIQKVSHLNGKKLINGNVLLQKLQALLEQTEKEYFLTLSA
ncbi:MAG TPA: aminotransferase class IV [Candidatus Sulfotelmatobacter sp.]|jgi:branched-subunit amino acid aminotransferase/4-amino-4-deoxychorismate lyase|nr:aminotransferase class IV [Candidatus Sulfotelmatobacter sp.]